MDQHRRDLGLVDAGVLERLQLAHRIRAPVTCSCIRVVPSPSTALAPRTVSTRIASSSLVKQ